MKRNKPALLFACVTYSAKCEKEMKKIQNETTVFGMISLPIKDPTY